MDSRDWSLNGNTISLDEDTVIDVPRTFQSDGELLCNSRPQSQSLLHSQLQIWSVSVNVHFSNIQRCSAFVSYIKLSSILLDI